MFEPVLLPQWHAGLNREEAARRLLHEISLWLMSEPLRALAEAWGGKPPGTDASLTAAFDWYDRFSAQHWDFRRGQERNLADTAHLNEIQKSVALDSAKALGLAESRPPALDEYEHILVLGGLVRACVVRARYAALLIHQDLNARNVCALGGFRPLRGDELELLSVLGIEADNEFGAMIEGVRQAFGETGEICYENPTADSGNSDWQIARFGSNDRLSVIAAPSSEPAVRRANTRDSYRWWAAERQADLRGAHILVITTTIYVPYQGAGATEVLSFEYGADVETVGVPPQLADLGRHTQIFRPDQYLQEVRSAIVGYRELAIRASSAGATVQ